MTYNHKKLVRAFEKLGMAWDDSKTCKKPIRSYGYKNPRDWARNVASCYSAETLEGHAKWIETPVSEWTQYEYDDFAYEELTCW